MTDCGVEIDDCAAVAAVACDVTDWHATVGFYECDYQHHC